MTAICTCTLSVFVKEGNAVTRTADGQVRNRLHYRGLRPINMAISIDCDLCQAPLFGQQ